MLRRPACMLIFYTSLATWIRERKSSGRWPSYNVGRRADSALISYLRGKKHLTVPELFAFDLFRFSLLGALAGRL